MATIASMAAAIDRFRPSYGRDYCRTLAQVTDEGLSTAGARIIALSEPERDRLHRSLEKIGGERALAASAPRVVVKHLKGSGPIRRAIVRRFAE